MGVLLAAVMFAGCALLGFPGPGGGTPATPSGLTVGSATGSSLVVSWQVSSGATSYQLLRDTSAAGSFGTKVYDNSDTTYTDSGLTAGTAYYYKVQATDSFGSSALSAAKSGSTLAGNVVHVSSDITTATTRTTGNIYVLDNSITVSKTLTIQPGVIVKVATGNGNDIDIVAGIGSTSITYSTFTHNPYGIDATGAGSSTTIANNTFYANIGGSGVNYPLVIGSNDSLDDSNTFSDAGGTTFNAYRGIGVNSNVDSARAWGSTTPRAARARSAATPTRTAAPPEAGSTRSR